MRSICLPNDSHLRIADTKWLISWTGETLAGVGLRSQNNAHTLRTWEANGAAINAPKTGSRSSSRPPHLQPTLDSGAKEETEPEIGVFSHEKKQRKETSDRKTNSRRKSLSDWDLIKKPVCVKQQALLI